MTTTHDPDATVARYIHDPLAPAAPHDVVSLVAAAGHLAGLIGAEGLDRLIAVAFDNDSPSEVIDGLLSLAIVAARVEADDADPIDVAEAKLEALYGD